MKYNKSKKKIKSVKNSLFYLITIGIIAVTAFFSLLQIQSIRGTFKDQKENTKSNCHLLINY